MNYTPEQRVFDKRHQLSTGRRASSEVVKVHEFIVTASARFRRFLNWMLLFLFVLCCLAYLNRESLAPLVSQWIGSAKLPSNTQRVITPMPEAIGSPRPGEPIRLGGLPSHDGVEEVRKMESTSAAGSVFSAPMRKSPQEKPVTVKPQPTSTQSPPTAAAPPKNVPEPPKIAPKTELGKPKSNKEYEQVF